MRLEDTDPEGGGPAPCPVRKSKTAKNSLDIHLKINNSRQK
jgi:hypothetical protein